MFRSARCFCFRQFIYGRSLLGSSFTSSSSSTSISEMSKSFLLINNAARTRTRNRFPPINAFLSDSNHYYKIQHGAVLFSTASTSEPVQNKNKPAVSAPSNNQVADMKILRTLASYLWMKDNVEFRLRVITALGFLVGAKVLNVQVPFLFKLAVDWLNNDNANANSILLALFATPAAVLIGYGIARSGASAFNGI